MTAPVPGIPAPIDRHVAIPGGEIFVREWRGAASAGTPLVLLHDSLGSVALWRDFPAALATATGRRIMAYDRLGFGQSSPRHDSPTIRFIVDEATRDFPALVDALGLNAYGLLGHSVGGAMAARPSIPRRSRAVHTASQFAYSFLTSSACPRVHRHSTR